MRVVTPSLLDKRANQKDTSFEAWLKENPAPDLGELIKTYGTFSQIPERAWLQWDQQLRAWQAHYRTRQWDT